MALLRTAGTIRSVANYRSAKYTPPRLAPRVSRAVLILAYIYLMKRRSLIVCEIAVMKISIGEQRTVGDGDGDHNGRSIE